MSIKKLKTKSDIRTINNQKKEKDTKAEELSNLQKKNYLQGERTKQKKQDAFRKLYFAIVKNPTTPYIGIP